MFCVDRDKDKMAEKDYVQKLQNWILEKISGFNIIFDHFEKNLHRYQR